MKSKYIKFRPNWINGDNNHEDFCLVFAEVVTHKDIASAMGSNYRAISAGFVGVDHTGLPHAYGDSSSLKLKADPAEDNLLLSFALRGLQP